MLIVAIAASNVLGSQMMEIMLLMPKDIWGKPFVEKSTGVFSLF
ncbi:MULTISPECIES: hypothetical protein [Photorhabdus]|nr:MULTISPECIES: hypothetical protein [Photorhabdus]MDB6370199.1 hypothetical protein [Photorhabdus bodei]